MPPFVRCADRSFLLIDRENQRARSGGRSAMKVALTGATGFIGSHVLSELQEHGHSVAGLVRDASQADAVADRGATATVVDLYDRSALVGILRDADAAIH